jgi:hypothetical protein
MRNNTVVLLFYIVTRTTGLPFLSKQAVGDPVTPLDLRSVAVNIPIIYCLYKLWRNAEFSPESVETQTE